MLVHLHTLVEEDTQITSILWRRDRHTANLKILWNNFVLHMWWRNDKIFSLVIIQLDKIQYHPLPDFCEAGSQTWNSISIFISHTRIEGHIQLRIIRIEMNLQSMMTSNFPERCNVQSEKQRSEDRTLRNTILQESLLWQSPIDVHHLSSAVEIRPEPC